MKRDIFKRGPRFTMRFGEAEKRDDPLGTNNTFDPKFPVFPQQRSGALKASQLGEHCSYEPRSAVRKPGGGFASFDGPKPDYAGDMAYPIPASTKKRKSP